MAYDDPNGKVAASVNGNMTGKQITFVDSDYPTGKYVCNVDKTMANKPAKDNKMPFRGLTGGK